MGSDLGIQFAARRSFDRRRTRLRGGKRDYPVGASPRSIAFADLDGSGKPDLVTANWGSATSSVLLNRGDGSFQVKRDYMTGDGPFAVAVEDLNGDRAPDVVTANSEGTASVLLNRGDGSFRPKLDYVPGLELNGLGLDRDRRLDWRSKA